MKKLADFIIKRRLLVLALITLSTLVFGYYCTKLTISTNFNDLLPQTHPYVRVHNQFRQLCHQFLRGVCGLQRAGLYGGQKRLAS